MKKITFYKKSSDMNLSDFRMEKSRAEKRRRISYFSDPFPTIWVYNENNY